jgi:hypothetical protein
MHNHNSTAGQEQVVPQDSLERILKLAHSGLSPEDISFAIRIDIEMVQQIIANDPKHRAKEVQSIKERSAEYRCTQSNRLMISPVMAHDENFYEQSILEADPSLSRDKFIPSKKLKAKIADFSKDSLKVLEGYLRQRHPQEDILELTAECLSVVIPDAGLESALRVLGAVEGETVRRITGRLRNLVTEEMLLDLMSQLARQLPSHALCLAALIILEPRSERSLEEAFRCFAELLNQVALEAGAIDLVEEVSERLSSSQLKQINAALAAHPSEGGDRLDGLRLKEAYALLREGEVDAATCIVNLLRISPRLEKEVLRFYDETGLSSGKVPILEQRLSAKLEEIRRDNPSLTEAFSIIHQLHKAQLQSHQPEAADQCLISQKEEVLHETVAKLGQQTSHALIAQDTRIQRLEEHTQMKEADDQETLASLRAKLEALTEELVKARQAGSQTQLAQDARIQRLEEQAQRKEADDQVTLASQRAKVEALTQELAKAEQAASQTEELVKAGQAAAQTEELVKAEQAASKAQDARIQRLEEQAQRKEADDQEALSSLRVKDEALTEELEKAGQEISQVKRVQDAEIQRLDEKLKEAEAATQECLLSLRAELGALHEQAAISGEEAKGVQIFIEQSRKAEAAAQEVLSSLRGEVVVLSKDLAQVASQCKRAQSGQEVRLQELSQKTEAAAQQTLKSLKDKVAALTEEHSKAGAEIKQVKRAQDSRIQDLNEKLSKAEAATQQTLNGLTGTVGAVCTELNQTLSQCKQVQEAILQRLEEQSQKTEANALKLNRDVISLHDILYHHHEVTFRTFIYSYMKDTDQLHRTSLVTGEQSSHQVPSYTFNQDCCWSEVPIGSLIVTGGCPGVREVVRINVETFEVSPQPHMLTPRYRHTAVYHTQHLYVLGGWTDRAVSECERYVCAENRWQALPPLPRACAATSGVVVEWSLYALGGHDGSNLDLVQKLSLESLTWEVMQLRLPYSGFALPCFKLRDTEVYLVVNKTLCSFTGLEVRPLKTLTEGISSWYGGSYYRRGTLYCSSNVGAVRSYEIGSLSN